MIEKELNETQEQNCVELPAQCQARSTNDLLCFSDRDLLVLAAKAIDGRYDLLTDCITFDKGFTYYEFDPINHDGEAFRLGVKLGLEMRGQSSPNQVFVVVNGEIKVVQRIDGDACKALRKAIVLAAAQIGSTRT
jgi:hypothetical protein